MDVSWQSQLIRVALLGPSIYLVAVIMLRLSGKRTLAKLNAFDLVITVALGSLLATSLVAPDVHWITGVAALGMFIGMQYLVALATVHIDVVKRAAKSRPTVVVRDGEMLHDAMTHERLSASEIFQAVRAAGSGTLGGIAAVVLETDGTLSVISSESLGDATALGAISGW